MIEMKLVNCDEIKAKIGPLRKKVQEVRFSKNKSFNFTHFIYGCGNHGIENLIQKLNKLQIFISKFCFNNKFLKNQIKI